MHFMLNLMLNGHNLLIHSLNITKDRIVVHFSVQGLKDTKQDFNISFPSSRRNKNLSNITQITYKALGLFIRVQTFIARKRVHCFPGNFVICQIVHIQFTNKIYIQLCLFLVAVSIFLLELSSQNKNAQLVGDFNAQIGEAHHHSFLYQFGLSNIAKEST